MKAGDFDQRVTLRSQSAAQDALGQTLQTWVDAATVWANVRYVSGIETVKSDAEVSQTRASIRIRYRSGVNTAMRVVHGSTVFEIKAVLPSKRNGYIDLACEANSVTNGI